MPNRLAQETSPYLLQHAHNPVDWYPWGSEALARAVQEDKPILLSIGYAACHWCHVMERESFESPAVAEQMNRDFVCIKVDREERPDLDEIYMAATVALSGAGGWPMTVFLTPEKLPFFAGTYFPPTDRYGRPGFTTLLERIAKLWGEDRPTLLRQAAQLTSAIRAQARSSAPGPISAEAIDRAARALEQSFDPRWGGFGSAPKFPPSGALELLLRHHARTDNERSLEIVKKTLDGMKNGGIYDHLGGGFARYSVDERWHVPHFEKMLYDNAELAKVYLAAYQLTRDEEYAEVARQTLDFVRREMQGEEGGYYSAYDADSEGEEGKFYVWQRDELDAVLEREAAEHVAAFYDVSPEGNWEGKNVLWRTRPASVVAAELGITPALLAASLAASREKLYQARRERVPPLCDDKVLTAWNGLMIAAMAEGQRVLGEPRFLESAERAARFALTALRRPDGGLYRTARAGRAHLAAYLEDYAYLSDALVTLYEAGGNEEFLTSALELAERMLQDFGDEGGAFHHTARDHEALLTRSREGHDGAIPNANSVAARALSRLAVHFDRPELAERAVSALAFYGELVERSPRAFATLLNVADLLLEGPTEVVFAGESQELTREVAQHYLPNHVIAHARPGAERPLLAGKAAIDGRPALYVCQKFCCLRPVTAAGDVASVLGADRQGRTRKPVLEQPRIAGRATAQGTARIAATFAARYPEGYRKLGASSLSVSLVGFGSYRIDGRQERKTALITALENGVNLIDTSTNYADGRSERAIGSVLRDLTSKKRLGRDEVVVVSKIGYVQGTNLELASEREKAGKPFPDMVKLDTELWHNISPEWLESQLTRSLARLELETLDVCLLHNPEYFLQEGTLSGRGTLSELRQEFYARLERAFGQLEREVERGRIGAYGVSSNTVVLDHDHRDATELSAMLEAARRAGGSQHHFQVLELPFNLIESGAYYGKSTPANESVLALAKREGIAVLVNRPLNAMGEQGIERLADAPVIERAPAFEFARNQVAALEREFRDTIAPSLRVAQGSMDVNELFAWSDHLADFPAKIESYEQWQEAEQLMVRPQVERVIDALDSADLGAVEERWKSFRGRYLASLEELLTALRARATERSRARTARLSGVLAPTLPESVQSLPLAAQALLVVASVPGVTSVLVGARQRAYVDDLTRVLQQRPLSEPERALDAVRAAR